MTDERSRKAIEHGHRIRAILAQPQYAPLSLLHQIGLLLALDQHRLDDVPLERVARFRQALGTHLASSSPQIAHYLETHGDLTDEAKKDLLSAMDALLPGGEPAPPEPTDTPGA